MKTLKTFENFPGSGRPDDYQAMTGDMSGDQKHMHSEEPGKVYTKDDVINLMYDFEIKQLGKFNPVVETKIEFDRITGKYVEDQRFFASDKNPEKKIRDTGVCIKIEKAF